MKNTTVGNTNSAALVLPRLMRRGAQRYKEDSSLPLRDSRGWHRQKAKGIFQRQVRGCAVESGQEGSYHSVC